MTTQELLEILEECHQEGQEVHIEVETDDGETAFLLRFDEVNFKQAVDTNDGDLCVVTLQFKQ